jgi:hypothetical protein
MDFFESHLAPWGILVFTTHGLRYVRALFARRDWLGLERQVAAEMLREFAEQGFSYRDYPSRADYGISLTAPAWVCKSVESRASMRLLTYLETGWRGTQDAVSCLRTGPQFTVEELLTGRSGWTVRELTQATRYTEKAIRQALRNIGAQPENRADEMAQWSLVAKDDAGSHSGEPKHPRAD